MTGQQIAAAWKAWIATMAGQRCIAGSAEGKYLKNRLEIAFQAGVKAAEDAQAVSA